VVSAQSGGTESVRVRKKLVILTVVIAIVRIPTPPGCTRVAIVHLLISLSL